MGVIKVDDIRDQVDELVTRLESGETILVQKDGATIARIEPVPARVDSAPLVDNPAKTKIDIAALRAFTDSQPMQTESAGDFIRRLRDEARY